MFKRIFPTKPPQEEFMQYIESIRSSVGQYGHRNYPESQKKDRKDNREQNILKLKLANE